jgi:hypothetical protein
MFTLTKKEQNEISPDMQLSRLSFHIDSLKWRAYSDPDFLLGDKGVRLAESQVIGNAMLKILRMTLSTRGYEKVLQIMRLNVFLGKLVNCSTIINELSYNFVLFGEPSITRPWGCSFYGHNLYLTIFLYKTSIVCSP